MNDPTPQTPADVAKAAPIAKRSLDIASATGTLTFANGHKITVTPADIPDALRTNMLLSAVLASLVTAYSAHRENPDEAVKAAEQRLTDIRAGKLPTRGDGTATMTALDVAIKVRADAKGIDEAKVRAVVEAESDEFKRQFVSKVKSDPLTAAAFAALRARKPKGDAAKSLDDLGI